MPRRRYIPRYVLATGRADGLLHPELAEKPGGHFDVQYADDKHCWCGGRDGEHVTDAQAEEGRR